MHTGGGWCGAVYPRECGGTDYYRAGCKSDEGLSPRVRGNRASATNAASARGSIPASAGEPPTVGVHDREQGVYPRECGGTLCGPMSHWGQPGLSPRVRGNLMRSYVALGPARSIPASAGEPVSDLGGQRGLRVYPRECGGTAISLCVYCSREGLSPRVRGNHISSSVNEGRHRSIPASAGEPTTPENSHATRTVYPRECGGTCGLMGYRPRLTGLSPRVRGNRIRPATGLQMGRSIPASAGEPIRRLRR